MTDLTFMDSESAGLNLSEAEDRAIFRIRVARRFRATTLAALNEWTSGTARDRATAVRALADKYINN